MTIIGSISWTPENPRAGESVKVDVCGPDDVPYENAQPQYIAIDGVAGSSQYMQFAYAGEHSVMVTAVASDGTREQSTATISVAAPQLSTDTEAFIASTKDLTEPEIAWLRATADVNILTVASAPPYDSPYEVVIAVLPVSRWLTPPESTLRSKASPTGDAPATHAPHSLAVPQARVSLRPPLATISKAVTQTPVASTVSEEYRWDFGDGTTGTSDTPTIAHDFRAALNSTDEFQFFDVSVSRTRKSSKDGTSLERWTRTLSVHNAYVACKKRGYVVPSVKTSGWAKKIGENFAGKAVIENVEPVPITLRSRLLIAAPQDTETTASPSALEAVDPPIVVPAHGSVTVQVSAPFDLIPGDSAGFSAVFTDQAISGERPRVSVPPVTVADPDSVTSAAIPKRRSAEISVHDDTSGLSSVGTPVSSIGATGLTAADPIAGLKVRATAHLLVDPQYRGQTPAMVGPINVEDLLDEPAELEAVLGPHPLGLDLDSVESLHALGLDRTGTTSPGHTIKPKGPRPDPQPAQPKMPPVALGNQCDPNNLPGKFPADLACQATPQTETIQTNAQFLNARKGDLVLCPSVGDSSLVDAMFALLNPPQLYGHSGIMTSNYEQITHCTASQSRLEAYTVGNILSSQDEGFDPDAVKYVWPGAITQTVEHAVNGEELIDPASSTAQTYKFQDFLGTPGEAQLESQFVIIPPLVVKPDPLLENDEVSSGVTVRELLSKVADDAYADTGNIHYRFYCFTNPEASRQGTLVAPAGLDSSSQWAEGTNGAVCSSFIWMHMKKRLANALGAGEYATMSELSSYASDPPPDGLQMQVKDGSTPDGLFYYSEEQRKACGQWLYNQVYSVAEAQAGWFGEALTGAAYEYANQLCNVFAADDSSTPSIEVQPWMSPGNANAISPENLLAWNGPPTTGCVLGYSEPLIYLPPTQTTVPVYKWAKVTQYGKITGHVYLKGKTKEGVTVQVAGPKGPLTTGTDAHGAYSFEHLPYGRYVINASFPWPSGPVVDGVHTGLSLLATGQAVVEVKHATNVAPNIELAPPSEPFNRTVIVSGHASIDCSEALSSQHHTTIWPVLSDEIYVGVDEPNGQWFQDFTNRGASVNFTGSFSYNPDHSVDISGFITLDLTTVVLGIEQPDPSEPGTTDYAAYNVPPGESLTFVIGNASSFLSGTGPQGWTYDGSPALEDENDTLCCRLTFTNSEWIG